MEIDGLTKNQTPSPTGRLRACVRMNLRRAKSAKISWAGSSHVNQGKQSGMLASRLLWSIILKQNLVFSQTAQAKTPHLSRYMTKPTKWLCVQQRLRSAWASAQSDQSLLSAWRNLGSLATHWAHSKDSDQTGQMLRLIRVFPGRTLILLVLSWCGSFRGWESQVLKSNLSKLQEWTSL